MNISISYFHDRRDNVPGMAEVAWAEVADGLSRPRPTTCTRDEGPGRTRRREKCAHGECTQKNGPSWSPTHYAPGATRSLAGASSVHALVLDLDHLPSDEAMTVALAKLSRYRRIVHSTHSDRPGDRCLRVVLALSAPVPSRDWPRFYPAALAILGIEEPADTVCRDASRLYFLPSRPSDCTHAATDGTGYMFESHDGEALDVAAIMSAAPPIVYESREAIEVPDFAGAPPAEVLADAATLLGSAWPSKDRHVAQLALSGALARAGWPAENIADLCAAVAEVQQPGNDNYGKRLQTARMSSDKVHAGHAVSGWPSLEKVLAKHSSTESAARVLTGFRTMLRLESKAPNRDDAFFERLRTMAVGWGPELARSLAEIRERLSRGNIEHEPAPLFATSARELLAARFPASSWLVHGLITRGGIGVIATEPKSAKTWTATEIAIAVSTGTRAFGEFATGEPGRVAYFYAEDFGQQVQNRIRALLASRGTEVPDSLHLQPRGRFLDVTSDADLALIVASCRQLGKLDLLVLDPLRDVHSGEEDSSDAMSNVMRRLRLLGELLGCTVLVVHHSAKSGGDTSKRRPGQRMRGSGAIHGSIDSGLYLGDLRTDQASSFTNQVQSEVKGARSAGAFDLTLEIQDDDQGAAVRATWRVERDVKVRAASSQAQDADDDRRVMAKVRELAAAGQEPLSKSALRELVPGVPDLRARAAIKRLVGSRLEIGTAYTQEGRVLRDRVLIVCRVGSGGG